jgi:hypothetical protein
MGWSMSVWLPSATPEAPFDPGHSWLFGEVEVTARILAVPAAGLLIAAGVLGVGHAYAPAFNGGCRIKPSQKAAARSRKRHPIATMRDDLATDDMRVTDEMAVFGAHR